ncbi:MAG: DNA replication complex subunit Gins51 [Thermoplasmatota archaeon]
MGEEGELSYEALQDLLRSERRTNKLMPLPASFWPKAQVFLATVTTAFRLEQARDPFGKDVMRLTDQVKNARHAAANLWALRERKMAMLALAQSGAVRVPEGATPDEAELFRSLCAVFQAARSRILSDHEPLPAKPAPLQVPVVEVPPPPPIVVPPDVREEVPMVTIRALADIPQFVGPDMQTYLLKTGDLALVPKAIGDLLARRKKAAVLES